MGTLITILVYLLICGLVAFLIRKAPFLDEEYKQIGLYILLVVFVLAVISLLLGYSGAPVLVLR